MESNVKRQKRHTEVKKEQLAKELEDRRKEEEEEENTKGYAPTQFVNKLLPKPIGMSKFEAERPEHQKSIESHAGALTDAEMEDLLRRFECCGYTREVVTKRAKMEALASLNSF